MSDNPYSPPTAHLENKSGYSVHVLWRMYFVYTALIAVGFAIYAFSMHPFSSFTYLELVQFPVNVTMLLAVYGYGFDTRFLNRWFWLVALVLFILFDIFHSYITLFNNLSIAIQGNTALQLKHLTLDLFLLISYLPIYFVVGLYVFNRPDLWQKKK